MNYLIIFFLVCSSVHARGQDIHTNPETRDTAGQSASKPMSKTRTMFGIASYYAEKFNGRQTANGEIYDGKLLTAACNVLPLGTWIRVTNLSNNRSVIVKTNDRLHPRMTRIVDLSRAAAERLGYISKGLTRVKVEVLEKKRK